MSEKEAKPKGPRMIRRNESMVRAIVADRRKEKFSFYVFVFFFFFLFLSFFCPYLFVLCCSIVLLSISSSRCLCMSRRSFPREDKRQRSGGWLVEMLRMVRKAKRRKIYWNFNCRLREMWGTCCSRFPRQGKKIIFLLLILLW